jgi:BolA protein
MSYKTRIEQQLSALGPSELDVIDESHKHHGHAGWKEGGETHFRVRIVSEAFRGQTRLARHRLVNELLAAELKERVHALAIEARAPGENGA